MPSASTAAPSAIAACATALPAHTAVIRLSGDGARAIAHRAGLPLPAAWRWHAAQWCLPAPCPCRIMVFAAPRSFTGVDTVEIMLPGSPDLVALAVQRLIEAGAENAAPGAFTRLAWKHGRLTLQQAESLLALLHSSDAQAAQRALLGMRSGLGPACLVARERLIAVRAEVESYLDVADDPPSPAACQSLQTALRAVIDLLTPWRSVADDQGGSARVALIGKANAGKSALFSALTATPALVADVAGTTRDWLEAPWRVPGRELRLIDTAGWLDDAQRSGIDDKRSGIDASAAAASRQRLDGVALLIACSAPDARLPEPLPDLPAPVLRVHTKADLVARAESTETELRVSAITGHGMAELAQAVAERLRGVAGSNRRQALAVERALSHVQRHAQVVRCDEILAEDCAAAADALADLIGITTPDEVLNAVFSRFCVGK